MGREDKETWKANYFTKLVQYLDEYPKCFIVGADNVGSRQMQQIRIGLRGVAVVLMGKNTMMRKAIKGHVDQNPALEKYVILLFDDDEELELMKYFNGICFVKVVAAHQRQCWFRLHQRRTY